jgi:hypothetical protein
MRPLPRQAGRRICVAEVLRVATGLVAGRSSPMRADEPPRARDGRRDGESVRGFEAGRFFRDVTDRSHRATPASSLRLPAGFRAELLDTVPSRERGSWVCLTNDPMGRLISSAQSGKWMVRP